MITEELRIESAGGVVLAGTLALPAESGTFPVLVGTHGARGGTRDAPLLQHFQTLLPQHAMGTFIFDRRGEGESTGVPLDAGFEVLAEDVRACVRRLRQHPRIDRAKLGLWSISQAGWITPLVAAADPEVACLVAVSPCAVTPSEQMKYATSRLMQEAGHSESAIAAAIEIRDRIDECCRRLDEVRVRIEEARSEPWFELAHLPDFAEARRASTWARIMDFDVTPALRRLRLPVLLIFGERDRWVPIEESLAVWRAELGSNADLTVFRVPGGGHSPTLASDPRDLQERGPVSPEYERALVTWLQRHIV